MSKKLKVVFSLLASATILSVPLITMVAVNENNKGFSFVINYDDYKNQHISENQGNQETKFLDFYSIAVENGWKANLLKEIVYSNSNAFGNKYYKDWYDSLSFAPFTEEEIQGKDGISDLWCTSEKQALFMYTVCWGHFWNMYLQQGLPIPEFSNYNAKFFDLPYGQGIDIPDDNQVSIRGSDVDFLTSALEKATCPINLTVYHGVEFMETKIYEQLAPYIIENEDGTYDFSNLVDKEFTSPGFLSTTTYAKIAFQYSNGMDWNDPEYQDNPDITGPDKPPFKVPTMFKINILENTKGVAYVSDFHYLDEENKFPDKNSNYDLNPESQLLIKKDSRFKISATSIKNGVQIVEMTMIS